MDNIFYMNMATALMAIGATVYIVWDIKQGHQEQLEREKFYEEEKEALGNHSDITLTRQQLERYFEKVLDLTASEKLNTVHIQDDKEIPQGVLLSHGEYKALLAFRELYQYNAEEKIKERKVWQEAALKASQDAAYIKDLHELG